ncbi:heat shock protein Hsp15 [Litoreibacter ponti]|uniref:Heat shock protein Hsp15 n=1 Tax=Litoreibacter ponti TaxID=1510457 RepID=A0A2T6BKN4_9RHOB|nr:heat shock protein Hsp15 [Litoreibacter ponti]
MTRETIRLDKWLWQARFFKTRTLAFKQVTGGHVRVNSDKVDKAATKVGAGDTLTFAQGRIIRVVEIAACGARRGPAPEAQALYIDKTPEQAPKPKGPGADRVGGRPTKKDRRSLDLSRDRGLE